MFKSKKLEIDHLLDDLPIELRKAIIRSLLPHQTAHAWLVDSGMKFTPGDVEKLANSLTDQLRGFQN